MSTEQKESIEKTKQGFEEMFKADAFYNKQTKDNNHLELILDCLPVGRGMKVLDLGTGTGYLAFPLAQRYKLTEIVGLDIVETALERNRERAKKEGLSNLEFVSYDGISFPFENATFDLVITRYALHHFPAIQDTFGEISRVLKPGGVLFLSDPAPNDNDTDRFVDEYMQMKKDGHIKFYTRNEWQEIAKGVELVYAYGFETYIHFPRLRETALEFDDIVNRHDKEIIEGYEVEVLDKEIWITEKVNNLLFCKQLP